MSTNVLNARVVNHLKKTLKTDLGFRKMTEKLKHVYELGISWGMGYICMVSTNFGKI